ncbi:hypothetical protein F4809DRAFT_412448 [Biscogniauxia mediterranea]|nr:hypothetical protein F4809DRAFT_412448 [Biscogniauxia mediterranea]
MKACGWGFGSRHRRTDRPYSSILFRRRSWNWFFLFFSLLFPTQSKYNAYVPNLGACLHTKLSRCTYSFTFARQANYLTVTVCIIPSSLWPAYPPKRTFFFERAGFFVPLLR